MGKRSKKRNRKRSKPSAVSGKAVEQSVTGEKSHGSNKISTINRAAVWVGLGVFLSIGLWIFSIYGPSFSGPFVFDDQPNIELNSAIRWGGDVPPRIGEYSFDNPNFRRPVAYATFGLNHLIHGYEVKGYRIVNLLIHLLNGLLIYGLVIFTYNTPALRDRRKYANGVALVASLLFLVHPVAVQSVAYIVQRMNSLATLFYLLSLLLYARARAGHRSTPWLFGGSFLAGLLAVGSKENAATLPLVILLYEFYFFQDVKLSRIKRFVLPAALVALLIFVIAVLYLGNDPFARILSGYATRDFTLSERLLTQLRVIVYYLTLLFFPHPGRLNLDYDFSLSTSLVDPVTTLLSLFVIAAMMGLAIVCARRHRLVSFAILFYFFNLVIESSIVALEIIFEHRTYLPFIFFFIVFADFLERYILFRWIRFAIITLLLLVFSYWTFERASVWGNEIALWRDVVDKSPGKARPHHNLGVALRDESRYREAIPHLEKALELKPGYLMARQNLGDALYNIKEYEAALSRFEQVAQRNNGFAKAYLGQGNSLYALGRVEESILPYRRYLDLRPADATVHVKLGIALAEINREALAIEHFRQAAELDSSNVIARWNLAVLMFNRREDADEVVRLLQEAASLEPGNANIWADLGLVLSETPRKSEATFALKRALELDAGHEAAGQLLKKLESE